MQLVLKGRASKSDGDLLGSFGRYMDQYGLTSRSIRVLAGIFSEFFGIPCTPMFGDIVKVAKICGIRVEESSMPLRGHWHSSNGKFHVVLRPKDSEFRRMFTLLHEIREIIHSISRETDRKLSAKCPEWQAETFASAVITGAGLVELSQYGEVVVIIKGKTWWATVLLWIEANLLRSPLSEWRDEIWQMLNQRQEEASNELVRSSFPNTFLFEYVGAVMNLKPYCASHQIPSWVWPAEIGFSSRLRLELFIRGNDCATGKRKHGSLPI